MTVYIVYECQGGHEVLVDCVMSSEMSATLYIEGKTDSHMYHYEEHVVDQC